MMVMMMMIIIIIPFLYEVSHCPNKDEPGYQIVPSLPTVPFYLEVT
jgi:hypothetical protein